MLLRHASLKIALVAVASLILFGCAMGGVATVSKPSLAASSKKIFSENAPGIFSAQDLSISIKPQNAKISVLTAGLIVPIIPLGKGNSVRESDQFEVVVQVETKAGNHLFSPLKATLTYHNEKYSPESFLGPLLADATIHEMEKISFGHHWGCKPPTYPSYSNKIEKYAITEKMCFVVRFPIRTISPGESFSVAFTGMESETEGLNLVVDFASKKILSSTFLGGN